MIKKIVNPQTKQATFVYPENLKRKPITVTIRSSLHATVIHQLHIKRFITEELTKFVNQRSRAYQTHLAFTLARLKAIDRLRAVAFNNQEGSLLALCIDVVRSINHFSVLAPRFNSPLRNKYDQTIQKIVDYCKEYATIRAPYCLDIH